MPFNISISNRLARVAQELGLQVNQFGVTYEGPLDLQHPDINEGEWFRLPIDPTVDIGKGIQLNTSFPSRGTEGSIKETWQHQDYNITISGVLIDSSDILDRLSFNFNPNKVDALFSREPDSPLTGEVDNEEFPQLAKEFSLLSSYCNSARTLGVRHKILNRVGVGYLFITNFDFPHTIDTRTQNYNISALSDRLDYNLIIPIEG